MNLHNINPFIRYARKTSPFKVENGYRLCYDCRLFYTPSGKGVVTIDNDRYEIGDDTAIFLPFGTKYSLDFSAFSTTMFVLNFDITDKYCHLENSLSTPSYDAHDQNKILQHSVPQELSKPCVFLNAGISSYLEKISQLFFTQPLFYRETSSGLLKQAFCELLGKCENPENAKLFDMVKEYIYKNYHDIQLSNTSIAAQFGYHPYYLASVIKQSTGKPLHRHISDYRISVSEDLLLTTEADVAEISWKCGFSSVSYYIKTFKEKYGCTPLKYRKIYRRY